MCIRDRDADAAVKSVLEQFSPERVRYVLANTIQQKDFDGRIPQPLKEWAKSVEMCIRDSRMTTTSAT